MKTNYRTTTKITCLCMAFTGAIANAQIVVQPEGPGNPNAPAVEITTLYETDFEDFNTGLTWAGQDGWYAADQQITDIYNSAFFGSQAASIGFFEPDNQFSWIFRDLNYDPIAEEKPEIRIDLDIALFNSTNGFSDIFAIEFFNSGLVDLGSIEFDTSDNNVYRNTSNAAPRIDTGSNFRYGQLYSIGIVIDFAANTWSADLGSTSLFEDELFFDGSDTLDLGGFDLFWNLENSNPANYGDNYLAIDDLNITARSVVPEPSAFALLTGAFTLLATVLRRRTA